MHDKALQLCLVFLLTTGAPACAAQHKPANHSAAISTKPASHSTASSAKTETPSILQLKELIERTLANNPLLKAQYLQYEAIRERVPQVSSLPDPKFSYGYFINPIETRNGPQEHKFGLSQTFPLAGKLTLKNAIAKKQAEEARLQCDATRYKLIAQITDLFYEYAFLRDSISVKKEHRKLLKAMESVADVRFQTGRLTQSALVQFQIEQGKIDDEIEELMALRPALSASIRAVTGEQSREILPWPPPAKDLPGKLDISALRQQVITKNPVLAIAKARTREKEISYTLAKKATIPDVSLGVEQYEIGGNTDATAATLSIHLPIWKKRTSAVRKEAQKSLKSVSTVVSETENQLLARLDMVYFKFNDSRRKVSLYTRTLIPKAEQAIDVAIKGFQTGTVGFLELLDAQRTLLEFELTGKKETMNTMQRLGELNELTGMDVRNFSADTGEKVINGR